MSEIIKNYTWNELYNLCDNISTDENKDKYFVFDPDGEPYYQYVSISKKINSNSSSGKYGLYHYIIKFNKPINNLSFDVIQDVRDGGDIITLDTNKVIEQCYLFDNYYDFSKYNYNNLTNFVYINIKNNSDTPIEFELNNINYPTHKEITNFIKDNGIIYVLYEPIPDISTNRLLKNNALINDSIGSIVNAYNKYANDNSNIIPNTTIETSTYANSSVIKNEVDEYIEVAKI